MAASRHDDNHRGIDDRHLHPPLHRVPAQDRASGDPTRLRVHRLLLADCEGVASAVNVREHMALRLAVTPYKFPAVRESHALDQLGMMPTRFWQYVGALIERADVEAEYPAEVRRLRRLREARAGARRVPAASS